MFWFVLQMMLRECFEMFWFEMLPHRHRDGQGACDAFRVSKCSACTYDGVARKHKEAIETLRDQYLLIIVIVVIFLVFLVHLIHNILDRVADNPLWPL